ncbi:hypothetical protein [Streptomyces sp. CA2R101]|uniref:hypothetical protein n=1 Tax=Streptomyces sp. CA2R101 TaxID=3120152 RepID=UPI00300B1F40
MRSVKRASRSTKSMFLAALLAFSAIACDTHPSAQPQIVVSPQEGKGSVDADLFGANDRYGLNGSGGASPATGSSYPQLNSQIRAAGLHMLRFPAGTMANTYDFTRAIGPQSGRSDQVNGVVHDPEPIDSTFGPDEFGSRLEDTGAEGDLMLNFGTGNAQQAAHMVQYMTGSAGQWADKRNANGHHAPYPIKVAEIGNEMNDGDQQYWMTGSPVSYKRPCSAEPVHCLYAFGGTTRFTKQPLSQPDDWRTKAGTSSGAAGQTFVARYAPVVAKSVTVYVNGKAWKRTDNLATAGRTDVYTLDPATGRVAFGNGTNGNIPPSGAALTIDYDSGPHDGFVDFYRAIKKVDPNLPVCSSLNTPDFLAAMGSSNPYDCVVIHPYVRFKKDKGGKGGKEDEGDKGDSGTQAYIEKQLAGTDDQLSKIKAVRSDIDHKAGSRASNIGILLSEYGVSGHPKNLPSGRWLSSGLSAGLQLRNWILNSRSNNIIGAERHALTSYNFSKPPADLKENTEGVLFGGPGPNTVAEPAALANELLSHLIGNTLVNSSVQDNKTTALPSGKTMTNLLPLATKTSTGTIRLALINRSLKDDVTAKVDPGLNHTGTVTASILNGSSYQDSNTPSARTSVKINNETRTVSRGQFTWKFPAHSITVLTLTPA